MTRTLIVLAGLLACTAARAEEPHEKWLKYLAGEWRMEDSLFGVGTSNWSFAPGNHALFGKGSAPGANGQTAEIIGWEPDKKALVHTVYGTTKGSYYRLEYTRVTDKELSGTDTGVMPDGRPYAGKMAVRRVDDRTFTYEYSGNYKDGKQEEYKSTGKAERVKPEGKVPAAKALRDFGTFFVDGVWTTTDLQGNKLEARGEWSLNQSFLKVSYKVGDEAGFILYGVDPSTGRVTGWEFYDKGGSYLINFTSEKEGTWSQRGLRMGKGGPASDQSRLTRFEANMLFEARSGLLLGGPKFSPETRTWIRKK